MESGGDASGAARQRFTWKGPVIVLGKESDPDPWPSVPEGSCW